MSKLAATWESLSELSTNTVKPRDYRRRRRERVPRTSFRCKLCEIYIYKFCKGVARNRGPMSPDDGFSHTFISNNLLENVILQQSIGHSGNFEELVGRYHIRLSKKGRKGSKRKGSKRKGSKRKGSKRSSKSRTSPESKAELNHSATETSGEIYQYQSEKRR